MDSTPITFTEEDTRKIIHFHNDPLVVILKIMNRCVFRMLIDTGSLTNILFNQVYSWINIRDNKMRPMNNLLYGFIRESVQAEGIVK